MANNFKTFSTFSTSAFNFNPATVMGLATMHAARRTSAFNKVVAGEIAGLWPQDPQKGLTINVVYPTTPKVDDYFSGSVNAVDVDHKTVPLTINHHLVVRHTFKNEELKFQADKFVENVLSPIATGLLEQIDLEVCNAAKLVPYTNPTAIGTNSYITSPADYEYYSTRMDETGAPGERQALLSFPTYNKMTHSANYWQVDRTGSGETLRTGLFDEGHNWRFDKTFGVAGRGKATNPDLTVSNKHVTGTYGASGAVNGTTSAGATVINIDGGVVDGTVPAGEMFTIAGIDTSFVVTEPITADAATANLTGLKFSPALPEEVLNDAVVSFSGSHVKNIFMSKGAIVAVSIPPSVPTQQEGAQVINPGGLSWTWVRHDRSASDATEDWTFSTYLATGLLRPEWAVIHRSAS